MEMNGFFRIFRVTCVVAGLGHFPAQAQDASSPYGLESQLQLSGYASLALSHDDHDGLGFRRNYSQTDAPSRASSLTPDSQIGVQLIYKPLPQWELAAQITAKDNGQNQTVKPAWLFAGWHNHLQWDVRAGLLPLDLFMMSEYLGLGYAQKSVRPPTDFYGIAPGTSMTGVEFSRRLSEDDASWRAKLQLGRAKAHIDSQTMGNVPMKSDSIVNFSLLREAAPWRLRLGYTQGRLKAEGFGPTVGQLQTIARTPALGAVSTDAQRMLTDTEYGHVFYRYASLGVEYDDGVWQWQSEFSRVASASHIMPQGNRAYVLLGRRVDTLTPYVMWSAARAATEPYASAVDWSAAGAGANQMRDQMVAFINFTRQSSQTLALGLRWDLNSRTALKFQWDNTHIDALGYAPWSVTANQRTQAATVDLYTVALDYVF